jgi:magnesium transporter
MLPLTVITGIYGMNFAYMPGLQHWLGFPLTLLSMALTVGVILVFFRRKGWLGKQL